MYIFAVPVGVMRGGTNTLDQATNQPHPIHTPTHHSYIAIVSAGQDSKHASRQTVLERERDFFLNNPLLQGLRSDRWGTVTLKQLLVRFQVRGADGLRWLIDRLIACC